MNNHYPAIPLAVHDPYFSLWSFSDNLNDSWSSHWTGAPKGLEGLIRVDGHTGIFSGNLNQYQKIEQVSLTVYATRTIYKFKYQGVELSLTFASPLLPDDPDVASRPLTYVMLDVKSIDAQKHEVAVYLGFNGTFCTDHCTEEVAWGRMQFGSLQSGMIGTRQQDVLGCFGDDVRINWGRAYLILPNGDGKELAITETEKMWKSFAATGHLPDMDSSDMPKQACRKWVGVAGVQKMSIEANGSNSCYYMLAYDDVASIEYLNCRLYEYWRRDKMTFGEMVCRAAEEREELLARCEKFDAKVTDDATKSGGSGYAKLCSLAYRQAFAAHKMVAGSDGRLLFFSKENFSNGCIATVDVTYPSAPLFLLMQPELLKGMLIPILEYAESRRWKFDFAPHDLGTYPLANGQVYGGGEDGEENQMPVEESGNMLILAGALLKLHGDIAFVKRYRGVFGRWAKYLLSKGYDPENQLCTDDFAGHMAHNTNLSLKAIMALGAYGEIAKALGEEEEGKYYRTRSEEYARRWEKDAYDEAEDCYRLSFDGVGSWSQKYNLVWDRILGLGLFGDEVGKREVAKYLKEQREYGLPLDCRKGYTKLDWIIWSGTLSGDDGVFGKILEPVLKFVEERKSRVPLTDWYETENGEQHQDGTKGFQARSVVGGVFIKMLYDAEIVKSYK